MTYEDCLKKLDEIGFKDIFIKDFESVKSESLIKRVKKSNNIYSVGSLLRSLIHGLEYKSEKYIFWVQVLHYFMMPDFVKDKKKLPKTT